MSTLNLFLQTSLLAKLVILILTCLSIVSWAIIIQRMRFLKMTINSNTAFEDKFWSGIELSNLYRENHARRENLTGLAQIFYAGFKEFARLHHLNKHMPESVIEGAFRAMRSSMHHELEALETYTSFLGIVSSISPYIGLFGTVWGIMHAFISLGAVMQATLHTVAPGIAEALITTEIGLFTAIPAITAYNYLNHSINGLEQKYDNFIDEFIAILRRQAFVSDNQ